MRIKDSSVSARRFARRCAPCSLMLASLALLQGCATNAPSCDGRFEPINLPAPVSAGEAPEEASSDSDADHE